MQRDDRLRTGRHGGTVGATGRVTRRWHRDRCDDHGVGAEPPTLTVFPDVATTGQVVTIRGVGFPTGLTVELTWSGSTQDVASTTMAVSRFRSSCSNTRQWAVGASVAGQTDQFGDVTATMLVTATTSRSQPSVLEGVGPNIAR